MTQYFSAKRILLSFMIVFLMGFPLTSHANCEVTFQWDASNQNLEGYQLFGREQGQDYDYDAPWWQGDGSFDQCTIDNLDESKTYFFVMRAFDGDDVSADSNEVRYSNNDNDNGSVISDQSSSGCLINSFFHG